MRCGSNWVSVWVLGGLVLTLGDGCVSVRRHRDLLQKQRMLTAEREEAEKEIFDLRKNYDNLNTQIDSLKNERDTQGQMIASLRTEADRLDEMRRHATGALENLAAKTTLSPINIDAPAILPPQLDSALKTFADAHPNQVIYDPAGGSVKWHADLLFDLGSDNVRTESTEALRGFCEILKSSAAQDFEAIVVGHTDNVPIAKPDTKAKHLTNWHLSAHRAIAVSERLQQYGYSPSKITIAGCSEYRPVSDNASDSGKKQNRRVDIFLVPRGSVVPAFGKSTRSASTQPTGAVRPASAVIATEP